MALVGETGTGKTKILRAALQWVSPDTKVAFITNFNLGFDDLLHMILVELGLSKSTEAPSKVEAICSLKEHAFQAASGGGRVVIILDEAQHLLEADLEKIRLLSNIETAEAKLLQMLLCGQPEVEAKIESTGMRQLKDRIAVRQHFQPLEKEQVREYRRPPFGNCRLLRKRPLWL
jgi:general secretion pathway protein A